MPLFLSDPAGSAAVLAPLSQRFTPQSVLAVSLAAGIFTHNQAEWYVQEVLEEAEQIEGGCKVSYVDWRVAPLSTTFAA